MIRQNHPLDSVKTPFSYYALTPNHSSSSGVSNAHSASAGRSATGLPRGVVALFMNKVRGSSSDADLALHVDQDVPTLPSRLRMGNEEPRTGAFC